MVPEIKKGFICVVELTDGFILYKFYYKLKPLCIILHEVKNFTHIHHPERRSLHFLHVRNRP